MISPSGTSILVECKRKRIFKNRYNDRDLRNPIKNTNKKFKEMEKMGIVYILMPFEDSNILEQKNILKKYEDYISLILKKYPYLYFVILITEHFSKEGNFLKKTLNQALVIPNTNPKIEPTQEIFDVISNPIPPRRGFRSLFD